MDPNISSPTERPKSTAAPLLLGRMTPRALTDLRAGSVLNAGGSTPRDRASPADWAAVVDGMQRLALSSRLCVPIQRGGAPGWALVAASPLLAPLLLRPCVSLSLSTSPPRCLPAGAPVRPGLGGVRSCDRASAVPAPRHRRGSPFLGRRR